jgi:hypothetical protein
MGEGRARAEARAFFDDSTPPEVLVGFLRGIRDQDPAVLSWIAEHEPSDIVSEDDPKLSKELNAFRAAHTEGYRSTILGAVEEEAVRRVSGDNAATASFLRARLEAEGMVKDYDSGHLRLGPLGRRNIRRMRRMLRPEVTSSARPSSQVGAYREIGLGRATVKTVESAR